MSKLFSPGEQVGITPLILQFAQEFKQLSIPDLFEPLHKKIYDSLEILPYISEIRKYEESRRWKLTATEVLQSGKIIDTKYCNDIVTIFIAVLKSLGIEAYLAKVFRHHDKFGLQVHSFVLVKTENNRIYIVNTGDKDYFWYKRLKIDFTDLKPGKELPYDWILWRLDIDQWAMGLNDSTQEIIIEEFAKNYYSH